MSTKDRIGLWVRAIRAPFFSATIMAAVIAGALAYSEGKFSWLYLFSAIFIIAGSNCGINLINDYFDHKSKNDELNKYFGPFSGGSRVIQDKLINPRSILIVGIASFIIVSFVGLYFVIFVNLHLLWFGLAAVLLGYFYTATPLKLGYRGLGEILVFIKSGPLAVCGTYLLFTGSISLEAILISIPQGLLITAILYINEFPDYEADKSANKRNIIVRIGREKARIFYAVLIIAIYLSVLIPVVLQLIPIYLLAIFITLPLAIQAVSTALINYNDERAVIPAQAKTILLTLSSGIVITGGYIADKFI
jgi:1,4-dihydroxy-2-naphthoate octaprenyltransferase